MDRRPLGMVNRSNARSSSFTARQVGRFYEDGSMRKVEMQKVSEATRQTRAQRRAAVANECERQAHVDELKLLELHEQLRDAERRKALRDQRARERRYRLSLIHI